MASTCSKVSEISKIGSGVGRKSLYEQLKEETYDENLYDDDDDFDDCGLTEVLSTVGSFVLPFWAKM